MTTGTQDPDHNQGQVQPLKLDIEPGYDTRAKLLKVIEDERNSKAILYVMGDRPGMETQIAHDVVDIFVDHLDELWPTERITLILHTTGGDTAAAWRLINLLRTFCDDLEVIVISKALSAGTLISLGADRIMMTKQATLGPIDPSVNGPLNPPIQGSSQRAPVSVEAVQGFLDLAKKDLEIADGSALGAVLNTLSAQIHPLVLGDVLRRRTQIRDLARTLLSHQGLEQDKLDAVIAFLCSESGSHDHTINRREARKLGLVIENPSEDFYSVLRELYKSVTETLQLRNRFKPDTILGPHQMVHYVVRRGLVESRALGSHQFVSEGLIKRLAMGHQDGQQQVGIQDQRIFEGWRKES
ncbi:SDH family Clp fold serine proteinase [Roseovarius pacificus]|uniref:SDH family Clp fold serine proteinase n=1 Tax=Roseovarius pacificus TaxID=337701 RepID=UPI00403A0801